MLDSVHLEQLGIPAITVVTAPFERAARAVAASQGFEELRLAIVPHDYLAESDAQIRARLDTVFDEIVDALFRSGTGTHQWPATTVGRPPVREGDTHREGNTDDDES